MLADKLNSRRGPIIGECAVEPFAPGMLVVVAAAAEAAAAVEGEDSRKEEIPPLRRPDCETYFSIKALTMAH